MVEDEKIYADRIWEYCQEFAKEHGLSFGFSYFKSGDEFLSAFENGKFSIVFMDVYMEGMSGVETARRLREKDSECILLFLTSSKEFMPDAFSCHAFEYILKPFTRERVFQVLEDAMKVMPPVCATISITSQRRKINILPADIMAAVSDGHYLNISLRDGTVLRSRMTMTELSRLLCPDPRFLSVNKGIILNADYIQVIEDRCCTLVNGTKFPIRVRDCLKVEQALHDYNFAKLSSRQRRCR